MVAFTVLGTVAGFAQDPCADAEGQTTLGDKFRAEFADKTIPGRKTAIETGKQFLEKYGACDSTKDLSDYLKAQIPKLEQGVKDREAKELEDRRVARFDTALKTKNWTDIYPAGKDLLDNYGDKYRDVELVLGTIGYDESFKNNFKHNDDTLKYARIAIADLEAGKVFSPKYGVPNEFLYTSKENAIGWMNLIIGYIISVPQKNRAAGLPYLYKATQSTSTTPNTTAKNPIPYEQIGWFYFGEIDKVKSEYDALVADQKETDTPEVAKQKLEAIKAKEALLIGTADRAIDAFSRAQSVSTDKAYKDSMKANVLKAFPMRFGKGKESGVDAWMSAAVKKPFVDPNTPVTPIYPEPITPETTTSTAPTTPEVKPTTPAVKPPAAPAKPTSTTTAKPAAAKPQAKAKKAVVKKKTA